MTKIALVLAAGKGTRMRSVLPKPLVLFAERPLVSHIIEAFRKAGVSDVNLVIGYEGEKVKRTIGNQVGYVYQEVQLGTAHAVMQAKYMLDWKGKDIFVFVGDAPLISPDTIQRLALHHQQTNAACTFLTADFEIDLPYARVLKDENGKLLSCIEEQDATEEEKKIKELLSSHFIFKADILFQFLEFILPHPKSGEYYLTEIIPLLLKEKYKVETLKINDYRQLVGLNTPEEVAWAEQIYCKQL
ncbi:MAG TPA: NTP transferase domain-containing protein [Cytophagaceae bacterium]|jgi:bifunctional N-acetylglucosamine-1-phosphate-uridyltransferase/glucosamine-1-phosphate-acetyltransferase GlmU-like protein|nr:NTP transferase domain-containing protein [Cytophagaceae bacterium]